MCSLTTGCIAMLDSWIGLGPRLLNNSTILYFAEIVRPALYQHKIGAAAMLQSIQTRRASECSKWPGEQCLDLTQVPDPSPASCSPYTPGNAFPHLSCLETLAKVISHKFSSV